MPSGGGPVYQPTTVSYEPRSCGVGGGGPLGLLGPSTAMGVDSPLHVFRKPRPQVALLLFGLISLAAGVAMIASGIADWLEAKEFAIASEDTTEVAEGESGGDVAPACVELPLGVLLGGVFMTCLGFVCMGMYLKVADWRRNCVCPCAFFDKKQSLARQLQCQNGSVGCAQGIMALNPSTDPLVTHTQYAPVSDLPSLRPEDEERRNLMPDNKDCLSHAEESDRMLEPDPRIVLRPMGRVEDA